MAQCCENWLWLVSCCGCRQRYVWDNISTSPQPAPTCPWRRIIKNWFLASNKDSVSPPPSQPLSVKLGFRAAHLNKHLKIFLKGEHVQNIFVQWWAVDSDVNIFNKNIWRMVQHYVCISILCDTFENMQWSSHFVPGVGQNTWIIARVFRDGTLDAEAGDHGVAGPVGVHPAVRTHLTRRGPQLW